MDFVSTKLYKYQEKVGIFSDTPGGVSEYAEKKEVRYSSKDGRQTYEGYKERRNCYHTNIDRGRSSKGCDSSSYRARAQ